jgi:hypothetical protein
MGLGLDEKGDELSDEVLNELIMDSRIETLGRGAPKETKPKKIQEVMSPNVE